MAAESLPGGLAGDAQLAGDIAVAVALGDELDRCVLEPGTGEVDGLGEQGDHREIGPGSLALGPDEPRPDLCLVVANNDGGGIFSSLEQAAFPGSFERLFGTPHGAGLQHLAAAFGLPYQRLDHPADLAKTLQGTGLRVVEAQTTRTAAAALRARLRVVAAEAIRGM